MPLAMSLGALTIAFGSAVSIPAFADKNNPLALDTKQSFDAVVRFESETRRHRAYEIRFPSALRSPFQANNTVWGHLLVPRKHDGKTPPCVLVLPVMAAPNIWIEAWFIRALLRHGYAVLWLEMPYQFHRRPSTLIPSGAVFLARTPRRLAFNFRQSALDARRAISWLKSSGHVNPDRIAIFGISLGAIVGASVLSVDDGLCGGIFLLGGADMPELVMKSSMTGDFVRKAGFKEEGLRREWRDLDPLGYKEKNRGKRVTLLNVRSDTIIPKKNALKLQEAFPDSKQIWLPFGHYSAMLHLLWAPIYVAREFRDILTPS